MYSDLDRIPKAWFMKIKEAGKVGKGIYEN